MSASRKPRTDVFKTSSSSRCGLVSSRVFYPLPLCSFKTNLIALASIRHISISTSVEPSPPFSRHLRPADTSIDLHLHRRRSPHLHRSPSPLPSSRCNTYATAPPPALFT
ncbi:hypothetical protein HanXRQr2_Chr03g0132191 [Helianthus annuus]|uniref:Uncharacterized protein n=1 Tax=Helianthus annuus TaxID=4232 RepID=A0A9K3JJR2_HELAN|nr:hypothetical protein HanXRQr2_Chr03g0132191 [Helianthus annuus]